MSKLYDYLTGWSFSIAGRGHGYDKGNLKSVKFVLLSFPLPTSFHGW